LAGLLKTFKEQFGLVGGYKIEALPQKPIQHGHVIYRPAIQDQF
jgi:hypothetical protein